MDNNKILYISIFSVSAAMLALEISLVRLFSISLWYHFAFMVVSIAMFGIAMAGTFLSLKKLKDPVFGCLILFSLTSLLGFFVANNTGFDPYMATVSWLEILKLSLYYVFLGLPFFFFGIIMAHSFQRQPSKSGSIYFFNLAGSALGAAIVIPLLYLLGPKTVVFTSIMALIPCLLFKERQKLVILLILLVSMLFFTQVDINISPYKDLEQALRFPGSQLLSTSYDSFSRVDVVNSSFTKYAPGLSLGYRKKLPPQLGVLVDGSGMNAITNPETESLDFVDSLPSSISYHLLNRPKTLVINSGAGLDVLAALYHNASVTALESNPTVVALLRNQNQYRDFSGGIYDKAQVVVEEGRGFVKRAGKYDLILISLSGNILGDSAGFYSLSENYLLTTEAFADYYEHLTDNGYLVVTRWLSYPPKETLRLFSLALEVDPNGDKTTMYRGWTTVTLLLSKKRLADREISSILEFTKRNGLDIIYMPADFTPNVYGKFEEPYYYQAVHSMLLNPDNFYRNYIFDVTPVYDDRPFYFNFFKFEKWGELQKIIGKGWQPFLDSGFLVLMIFAQALVLAVIFVLMPLLLHKKAKARRLSLAYFCCIGISYMMIEVMLIQRLIMFLGHVIYSTTTVIFSILLFSGIGSLASGNFGREKLKYVILLLFVLTFAYYLTLSSIIEGLISMNLTAKIIISVLLVAPLGVLMGMPFPVGIRNINKRLVSWAWAVNGSASVISPVLATMLALSFGYSTILLIAGMVYAAGYAFFGVKS